MGWCGGTDVFDCVAEQVLEKMTAADEEKYMLLKNLADKLEDLDWDCQDESQYNRHPLIQRIWRELHPDWYEDEE